MNDNNDIIRISEAMMELDIQSIVYLPPSELVPRDTFNVYLFNGAIGNGLTVADALEQAKARKEAA